MSAAKDFSVTAQLEVSVKSEPSEQHSTACQADRMGRGSRQGRMIGLKVRMKWDKWGTLLHFVQETILSKRPGFNVLHFRFSRGSLSLRECRQLQFLPEEDSLWLVPLAASSARKAGPTQAGAPCVWRGQPSTLRSRQLRWMSGKEELQTGIQGEVSKALLLLIHFSWIKSNVLEWMKKEKGLE